MKLLGDGVMFHFPDPAQGVCCGLELVDRIPEVGLPRARVGLHSGPVVFQHGDYFGRTVNIAARITDHARPGEVLVSDQVVADADPLEAVRFRARWTGLAQGAERSDHPLQRRPRPLTPATPSPGSHDGVGRRLHRDPLTW